ncbi:hypothetical protein IKS57_03210, partial [bacterium]|nr:hypothetical protein [bacterium]
MKKAIKISLEILGLTTIAAITVGSVISCSNNNNSSNQTTKNTGSNIQYNNSDNSTNNNSENTLYQGNAEIMASILPDILPTNISISNSNNITALTALSNENNIQQLKSQIKSQLIYSMNVYCGYYSDNSNTTVCTVLGTKYTAQFIAENLSINLPTLSNLKVNYSPNQTIIPNVTLNFDNCLIKENFIISNFISPLEAFDSYKLQDILSTVSLNNLNTTFPQISYTTLSQDIENNIMEQLNKNSNKLVINGFNLTADEIMGSLNISIPKTISYLNGSLQN